MHGILILLVIAVLVTLLIGIPIDVIALSLVAVQTCLMMKGEMLMVGFNDSMVVCGVHGAACVNISEIVGVKSYSNSKCTHRRFKSFPLRIKKS